jgi:hypothetical protein
MISEPGERQRQSWRRPRRLSKRFGAARAELYEATRSAGDGYTM